MADDGSVIGMLCGTDIHSCKVRDPEDGFRCGNSDPDCGRAAFFVVYGADRGFLSFDRNDQRKILSVPDPVGTCNGSFMDLLF